MVLADGAGVQLSFEGQPRSRPILVEAAVAHATQAGAAGLLFVRMAAEERERLRRPVLKLMAKQQPPRPAR